MATILKQPAEIQSLDHLISADGHGKKKENPRIVELEEEIASLRAKLDGQDPNAIVQRHIHLLHTYNEIKDGAQALIAQYARTVRRPLKEVYEEWGLPLTE
ncbi:hypothetical protein M231_03819 [Tremella mesenterica]|uniref:DNA repair protein Swi5/Sae3 n=1 Tax=Tremella mesenterica TaxID=5217 RepID=A0A4Q1BMC8_TREME|nr:hypothetical protein M231_03819 [Tremella mesenterica]